LVCFLTACIPHEGMSSAAISRRTRIWHDNRVKTITGGTLNSEKVSISFLAFCFTVVT
jgi:hypothetical protein